MLRQWLPRPGEKMSAGAPNARDTILDVAEKMFAHRGFHETKLRDIAAQVGVTQPLIHHHFGSKDALYEAVVLRAFDRYESAQKEQWSRDPTDVRFFTEGITVFSNFVGEHRASARLFTWAGLECRMPEFPAAEKIDATIRQKFVDAQDAGVLRDDVEVDVLRLMIDGAVRGFWERADASPALQKHAKTLSRAMIRAMMPAILTETALEEALVLMPQDENETRVPSDAER